VSRHPGPRRNRTPPVLLLAAVLGVIACGDGVTRPAVVVYTSVDQVYAEPILREFERASGIRVLAVYDVEAAKTTGLVTRLLAERGRPRADLFWSGEVAQTLRLAGEGVLAAWRPPEQDRPGASASGPRLWHDLGGRARVLLVNRDLVRPGEEPRSLSDLLEERWPADRVGISNPLFGTSFTHAAALYAVWGPERARGFFRRLAERGVRVVDGNSVVRDLVADGRLLWGVTDSDDAGAAVARGAPVRVVLPDQDGDGALVIPGTVALVANCPHPAEGRALAAYLASPATEAALVVAGFCQVSLGNGSTSGCLAGLRVKALPIAPAALAAAEPLARADLRELFAR
jgi:iron(III) transport system substrate-binding protein